MISRFFIDRPIFANVIAVVTVLFGVVALYRLPVERYPQITPPTVVVSTNYPGANAQVVADTVAAPVEQAVNGVENMTYMSSTSSSDGSYSLTIQDLIAALQEQNVQVAAGAVGQPPGADKQAFQYTVTSLGRLSEPGQFENIVVKTGQGGRVTYLRDVAKVELGAQTYDSFSL